MNARILGAAILVACGLLLPSCGGDSGTDPNVTAKSTLVIHQVVPVLAGYAIPVERVTVTSTMMDAHLVGDFRATGGSGDDIKVHVMMLADYNKWQGNGAPSTIYSSGKVSSGTFNVALAQGEMVLVLDNLFSSFSSKNVDIKAELKWLELSN